MSARPSAAARYSGEKPLPSTTAASPPSADTSFSRTASWPFRMASCIAVAPSEFLAVTGRAGRRRRRRGTLDEVAHHVDVPGPRGADQGRVAQVVPSPDERGVHVAHDADELHLHVSPAGGCVERRVPLRGDAFQAPPAEASFELASIVAAQTENLF
ncbi:hypothetical protein PVAP13_3NG140744 [Panicum virgatum]|uniref:Uncharacterized protein n=1 Tax=Panicum virgatum TaxID=38727 RepID=A0A8T0U380_PANVG|nr:hypothetical protein PVAP13_3NG140744 [Panicum virgatum]